jgi:hypothetical protein
MTVAPSPVEHGFVQLLLTTLQQVSGPQYPRLLYRAGLIPAPVAVLPPDIPLVLTADAVQQLLQAIRGELGEDVFRLCRSIVILTQQTLTFALANRVEVAEIACHAQGAAACAFTIAK